MWTFSQLSNYPKVEQKSEWAQALLKDSRIVEAFQLVNRLHDEPCIFSCGAKTRKNYPEQSGLESAGGTSFDRSVALMKTAGEAAERFSLTCADPVNFSYGKFSDESPSLKAEQFRFYSEHQVSSETLRCFSWSIQDNFLWTDGINLVTEENVKLPAQLIYSYEGRQHTRPEPFLFASTSTGTACGRSVHDSSLSAMLELIERDAFMVHYLSRTQGVRVDVSSHPLLSEIEEYLKRFKLRLQIYHLQTDFPVCPVLALITEEHQDTSPSPWLAAGLKCSFNSTTSVLGAVEEACQARLLLRATYLRFLLNGGTPSEEMLKDVIIDRALYWRNPDRAHDIAFFTQTRNVVPFNELPSRDVNSPADALVDLLDFCKRHHFPVYRADITAPEVREHGLVVSRVLMPTLQQFYLMEPYLPLASERWRSVPRSLGFSGDWAVNVNTTPHFFL
jgi:ribosomal protein S12 methylthiotransferase accessory factor